MSDTLFATYLTFNTWIQIHITVYEKLDGTCLLFFIERTKLYNKQHLKSKKFTNIFYGDVKSQLQTLLNMKYPNQNCDLDNIIKHDNWQIGQILHLNFIMDIVIFI